MKNYIYLLILLLVIYVITGGCELDNETESNNAINITINLDNVPPSIECGESWTESGITLSIIAYDETCAFDVTTDRGEIWLFPAKLTLDLSNIDGVIKNAEVDITDYCGEGCTSATLLKDSNELASYANTDTSSVETLTLSVDTGADQLIIMSYEGKVSEIRLQN